MSTETNHISLRPSQLAEELGINVEKVLGWIKSGELTAYNVGNGTKNPRWRIYRDDLNAFLKRRSNAVDTSDSHARRLHSCSNIPDYVGDSAR